MKNLILLLTIVLCVPMASYSQSPADLAGTSAVQETQNVQTENVRFPEDALVQSMTQSLAKQNKALGVINDDGSIYVVGAATTARASNMPGFINSRNIAYSIAELTAKMNLLRMAGEQISSGRGFQLLENIMEGEDPDAKDKASRLEKAARLEDQSMDNALAALGVSDEEIRQMNTEKKQAAYEQNFNQTIRSLVAGMIKGCAVVRIAEGEMGGDDYQIAVCLKYSPEFQSFASVVQGGGQGLIPSGTARSSKEKILQMPVSDLVMRMGVWMTYNENGEMVIYGFGQQEVLETGSRQSAAFSRAYSQARLQAINNIKNFVAEDIVANEVMQDIEKLREYADGTNAYFSSTRWEQAVKAQASTLNLATEQVRQWSGIHPASQTHVAGYVVAWTYSNAQQANKLRNNFDNSGRTSTTTVRKGEEPHQPTKKGVITITGDDEDL